MTLFARYKSTFAGLPRPALLLATVLLVNTSGTMVVFFMTLYLTRHLGWPAARAGLGMSGYGVGMLAGTLTGGLLSDRLGAFKVQRLSLTGAGLALTPLGNSMPYLAVTVMVWTFGEMLTLPLLTTLVSLRASASAQGRYQGLYTMSYSVGVTIGPVLGTWIYTTFGGPMLWTAVGGVGAIVAGSMLILSLKWDGRAQVGSAASA